MFESSNSIFDKKSTKFQTVDMKILLDNEECSKENILDRDLENGIRRGSRFRTEIEAHLFSFCTAGT